ncbi:MAG TPA: dihydrofolate reductase family protein [Gemmatimonadaceae bacterium]|jgi:dihydrofolate reductase|nr:dihydrofolate reductase family protein [Gemmatimonadaceae bacterium]
MRKIINSTFVTIDAAIESPHLWPSIKSGGDEAYNMHYALLQQCDAVLMGRRTYESFAAVWPTRSGDSYSDRINAMQKYVVSSTITTPEWNNTSVISGHVVDAITRLKQQPGKDIVQYGLGDVSFLLMAHGLMDEIRLWVHPLILGQSGPTQPPFRNCPPSRLHLTNSQTLANGIAILRYDVESPS